MNLDSKYKPSLESIFKDFDHPNPNINKQSFLQMKQYYPQDSIRILISNLDSKNLLLRRKSVKAIASLGSISLKPLVALFVSTKNKIVQVSCLKSFVLLASGKDKLRLADLSSVIDIAINDESPEVILSIVLLLKQLGEDGLPYLFEMSQDRNVLRVKSSLMVLSEINLESVYKHLLRLVEKGSSEPMIQSSAIDALKSFEDLKHS